MPIVKTVTPSKASSTNGSYVEKGKAHGSQAVIAEYAQLAKRHAKLGHSFKIEITVTPDQAPVIETHLAGDALDQAIAAPRSAEPGTSPRSSARPTC